MNQLNGYGAQFFVWFKINFDAITVLCIKTLFTEFTTQLSSVMATNCNLHEHLWLRQSHKYLPTLHQSSKWFKLSQPKTLGSHVQVNGSPRYSLWPSCTIKQVEMSFIEWLPLKLKETVEVNFVYYQQKNYFFFRIMFLRNYSLFTLLSNLRRKIVLGAYRNQYEFLFLFLQEWCNRNE